MHAMATQLSFEDGRPEVYYLNELKGRIQTGLHRVGLYNIAFSNLRAHQSNHLELTAEGTTNLTDESRLSYVMEKEAGARVGRVDGASSGPEALIVKTTYHIPVPAIPELKIAFR